MTAGDGFLIVVGVGLTVFTGYVFVLEWRDRRRPVAARMAVGGCHANTRPAAPTEAGHE